MDYTDDKFSFSEPDPDMNKPRTIDEEKFTPVNPNNSWEMIPEATEKDMKTADYLVAFSGQAKRYCVGIVDMSAATMIVASAHRTKMMKYYEIFLNSMSRVLSKHDAFVIKNGGDSLLYYFSSTSRSDKQFGFMNAIECGLELLEIQEDVSTQMEKAGLPYVNYRVSSDYGQIVLMKSSKSLSIDMIGAPLTICSKITAISPDNVMVIGKEMYDVVKGFNDYRFEERNGHELQIGYQYTTYSVTRKP